MKAQKIKRYRLPVSRTFPTTHKRAGEKTYFVEKILKALYLENRLSVGMIQNLVINLELRDFDWSVFNTCEPKCHTIRASKVWIERIKEVQSGSAVIELFYWSGKPYHKDKNGIGQVVFATLDKDSGCGVQKLVGFLFYGVAIKNTAFTVKEVSYDELSKNDGLSHKDFKAWFKGSDLSQPMAIIHFTKFRY